MTSRNWIEPIFAALEIGYRKQDRNPNFILWLDCHLVKGYYATLSTLVKLIRYMVISRILRPCKL